MNLQMKMLNLAFFFIVLITDAAAVSASETARKFIDAISSYQKGSYEDAISKLSEIADTGVVNGQLYYNLGNAYLKKGDIGYAVLWYERALKLNPQDPDLKFNYEYALSFLKDDKGEKEFPIVRILFFWKYLLSPTAVQWIAIFFNSLFWTTAAILAIVKKRKYRWILTIILLPALIFIATSLYNSYEAAYLKEAVILPPEVTVRSGLTDDSTVLFVLHAGTKVTIEKEKDDYFRIFFTDGKIGWIRKQEAGII